MYYKPDLHVAMNGLNLQWVGGVDVYVEQDSTDTVTRFVFDAVPYDYVDPTTGISLKDMTPEEFEAYKEQLKQAQLAVPAHAKFLTDYEDAITKGLY